MTTLNFHATGHPITQGSKIRTKWAMRESNHDRLHPWRDTITNAAITAMDGNPPITGPCSVRLVFRFRRAVSHYGTGRNATTLKPTAPTHPTSRSVGDIDKLARAVLDALTAAAVWGDDSQVAVLYATKTYDLRDHCEGVDVTVIATPHLAVV